MQIKYLVAIVITACTSTIVISGCCKKKGATTAKENIKFDIPFIDTGNAPAITFPDFGIVYPYTDSIISYQVPTYSDSLFKQNGTTAEKIVSIKAKSLTMSIRTPNTFDFADSLTIFVANKNGSNKILLGRSATFPPTASILPMILSNAEFKEYIKADSFKLIVGGRPLAGKSIKAGTVLDFSAIFGIEANP